MATAKAGTTRTTRSTSTTTSKKSAAKPSSRTTTTASKKTPAARKPRTPAAPQPSALEKAQAATKAEVAALEAELARLDTQDANAAKAQAKRDDERDEINEALRQYPKKYRTTSASKRSARSGRLAANATSAARQALGSDRNWFVVFAVILGIVLGFGLAGVLIWLNLWLLPGAWGLVFVWLVCAPILGGLIGHWRATKNDENNKGRSVRRYAPCPSPNTTKRKE